MSLKVIVGIIMGICFVGIGFCAKKQHTNPKAKPLAIVFVIGIIICTGLILNNTFNPTGTEDLINKELHYTKASAYVLGKELAKLKPGAKVLVIADKQNELNLQQKTLMEGLKEGFGSAISSVTIKTPKIDQKDLPPEGMPIEEVLKAEHINKMFAKNKSYDLIVFAIGLPMDFQNLKIWEQFEENPKKTPKLSMLKGDISMLYPAIKSGLVPALITHSPDADFSEDAAPESLDEAFKVRYLLITTKNVDEITKKYSGKIFRKPGKNL